MTGSRPGFSDIEAWGVTHRGRVRSENQDHFLVGALARGTDASGHSRVTVRVEQSSIDWENEELENLERIASLGIVADGVGGSGGGEEAARRAVEGLAASVAALIEEAEYLETEDPEMFSRLLHEATLAVHGELLLKAEKEEGARRFATTLTLFLGFWPHAYLLQVGDSRCYVYREGALTQITRDQTLAQELVDQGVMSRTKAEKTRWANVLSSAVGGSQAEPVVTRVVRDWGTVVLMCSDGLTTHVTDEQIEKRLASMTSAREAAEQLVQDALDGGGTDNITVALGRTLAPAAGRGG